MKNYYLIFIFLSTFFSGLSFSQHFENYIPLRSKGEIPEDFRTLLADKVASDKQSLLEESKRKVKKDEQRFLIKSNYMIEQLLLSGRVLFNDTISQYINEVADILLIDKPEVRRNVRIYTIKSSSVNAFTSDNGIIFVTTGLLAQLENEAQLAFILCHEFTHYIKKHAMDVFKENENANEQNYRWESQEKKLLAINHYSQEIEFEADQNGFELFASTDYSLNEIYGAFDVLQYSYLPIDEIVFNQSFLETENFIFPDNYFSDTLASISGDDNYDDSKSTHPNIRRRRDEINKLILQEPEIDGQNFLISQEKFYYIRDVARFELCHIMNKNRLYPEAIYNAYILLKEYPENIFLQTQLAKALLELSIYKTSGNFQVLDIESENIEGNIQQVFYLLEHLSEEELSTLAVHYIWNLKKSFPDDTYINQLAHHALSNLILGNDMTKTDFSKITKAQLNERLHKTDRDSVNFSNMSKYEKIKYQKENAKVNIEEHFAYYAFVDLFQDNDFLNIFEKFEDINEKNKRNAEVSWSEKIKAKKLRDKTLAKDLKKGKINTIDKIVIVDPFVMALDERKKDLVQYYSSEKQLLNYIKLLDKSASLTGLDYNLLDSKSFKEDDIEKFNHFAALNEWMQERMSHYLSLEQNEKDSSLANNYFTNEIIDYYNTSYFLWSGSVTLREKKSVGTNLIYLGCLSVYFFPALPIVAYYLLKPEYKTYYYSYLFDLKSGELMYKTEYELKSKSRKDITASLTYKLLKKVSRTPIKEIPLTYN